MVMSITVFVSLQSFGRLLDTSRAVQEMHLGDYAVTNETIGIPPNAVKELSAHEAVERLLQYVPDLTEQDLADLEKGTACLAKNPIPFTYDGQSAPCTELRKDDIISVNNAPLRVAGIAHNPVTINNAGFTNGVQIIVSGSVWNSLTGQDSYSEVYPVLHEDADIKTFEAWLKEWSAKSPGTHWLSYQESDAQLAESFAQINLLCNSLILFIGLIGVLNIINTVYTNIHTRINEIGMQRAIGMSRTSLYKTFLWEGACYGLISSAIGAVTGYICTIFINAAVDNTLQLTAFSVIPVLQAALVSILACLTATAVPLRAIAKMDIVSSILTIE